MKRILGFFLVIAAGMYCVSCVGKIDDLFDQTANERVENFIAEAQAELVSKEKGWILEYYPDMDLYYGGFLFLMKFDKEGNVTVTSEIATDATDYVTSNYSINSSSGPVITFDTYNDYIHYFSDPDLSVGSGIGEGYKGDFEFYIKDYSPQEVVIKGIKTEITMRFRPFPEDMEWDDYMKEFKANKTRIMESGAYAYVWDNGGNSVEFEITRNMPVFSYIDPEYNDPNILLEIPFAFTIDGIRFLTPQQIHGVTMQEFIWDNATSSFTSVDGSVVLTGKKATNYRTFDQFIGRWNMTTSEGSYNLSITEPTDEKVRLMELRQVEVNGLHSSYDNIYWNYSWSTGTIGWPPQRLSPDYLDPDSGIEYPFYCFITDGSGLFGSTNIAYTLSSTNVGTGTLFSVRFIANEEYFETPGMGFIARMDTGYRLVRAFLNPVMTKQQ